MSWELGVTLGVLIAATAVAVWRSRARHVKGSKPPRTTPDPGATETAASGAAPDAHASAMVIRFGHAFPHPNDVGADPVEEATQVLCGDCSIGPRDPQEHSVVWKAEAVLGIERERRPVYAYVGCLHPKLGRIGFIIGHAWFARDPHGVSRCDTGGLAGRMGGFKCLEQEEAHDALVRLSHPPNHPWIAELMDEVSAGFGQFRSYLGGIAPNPRCFSDVRQKCIDAVRAAREELDRRLWTWEARSFAEIERADVEAVALAPEAYKELIDRLRPNLPSGIHFLPGQVTSEGIHHFEEEQVVATFERGSP